MSIQKMREDIGILARQLVLIEQIRAAETSPNKYASERKAAAERKLQEYLANYPAVTEIADRRAK